MKKRLVIGILLFLILILPMIVYAEEGSETKQAKEQKSVLEQEIEIPENLQFLTRVLFGLKPDTPVIFQEFIVLIATLAIFFFIIRDIIVFVPFFDTTIKSVIGAIIVTLLAGSSGGFLFFADLMLSLGFFFGILERWPIISTTMILILLFAVTYLLNKALTGFKRKSRIEEARIEGLKTGASAKMLQEQTKILGG